MINHFEAPDRWIHHAQALAEKSLPQDVPVGAVIVDENGNIIGEGWNTREQDQDPTGHAELLAIRQAGMVRQNWRLNGCTLYVTLEPCPMCASALLQSRISQVVFGAYDPVQGALGSALNLTELYRNPVHITGGIDEKACQKQLQEFFKAQRDK